MFAAWIRARDTADGYRKRGICVTCGKLDIIQCGHFVKRQHTAVRWDERNCHGQCARCNHWLHGNEGEYAAFIVRQYGDFVLNELLAAKHKTVKMTRSDYEAIIEKYK